MVAESEIESASIPSVKDLASSEPSLRRKNLQQIILHLQQRACQDRLTRTQALQIWRGFHVALYMHDSKNQLSVQTLTATLASTFKIMRHKDIELRSQPKTDSQLSSQRTDDLVIAPSTNGATKEDEEDFHGFDDVEQQTKLAPSTSTSDVSDDPWLSTHTQAFWETIVREWSGIDQWRMNKYLLLVRFSLREIFSICLHAYFGLEEILPNHADKAEEEQDMGRLDLTRKRKSGNKASNADNYQSRKRSKALGSEALDPSAAAEPMPAWNSSADANRVIERQMKLLSMNPLSPRGRKVSDGLRLHTLDIYLDELLAALRDLKSANEGEILNNAGERKEALIAELRLQFLEPVRHIAADGLAKHVRIGAKDVLKEFEDRTEEFQGSYE